MVGGYVFGFLLGALCFWWIKCVQTRWNTVIPKVNVSYCFFIAMSLEILYIWKQKFFRNSPFCLVSYAGCCQSCSTSLPDLKLHWVFAVKVECMYYYMYYSWIPAVVDKYSFSTTGSGRQQKERISVITLFSKIKQLYGCGSLLEQIGSIPVLLYICCDRRYKLCLKGKISEGWIHLQWVFFGYKGPCSATSPITNGGLMLLSFFILDSVSFKRFSLLLSGNCLC